jgi:hypothetical protein
MTPGAFAYKQPQQPAASPTYPTGGGLDPSPVAAFRQPTAAAQPAMTPSASNPYAPKPAATPATAPYQNNYGGANQLSSIPGINQVLGQYHMVGQMDPLASLLKSLGVYMYPQAASQEQFAGQLEPQRQAAIQNYLNYASPASQQAQVNTYGNQAMQNANEGAMAAGGLQRAAGLGTGYQAGNDAAAGQSAANAKNEYQQQVMSPQYQQQLLQGLMGAIGQGQSLPALQQLLQMNPQMMQMQQMLTQQQQQNAGGGPLGSIFGALTGGGGLGSLAGLFGGGGGGGLSMPFGVGGAGAGVFA